MAHSLLIVVGARPNFVKVAPVVHALTERAEVRVRILHTGQHYDHALSGSFIEQLGMPRPDQNLDVGSGSHAEQTAAVLVGVEKALLSRRPDALLVAGDVNSTVAAALAATKIGVPVAHLESGLRSRDWTMPEEINRVVTDRISDLLLCHCQDAVDNLAAEGIAGESVMLVGNTMIDSLLRLLPAAEARRAAERHGLQRRGYVLVTLHRPALVDDPERLCAVIDVLEGLAERIPVVFPLHPRTRERLQRWRPGSLARLLTTEPLDYLDFVALEAAARLVITDSGGVQEETSALGVPCLTYRDTTERPVTTELGTNTLVGTDPAALARAAADELSRPAPDPGSIPLWDGRAGPRAADALLAMLESPEGPRPSAATAAARDGDGRALAFGLG